MLELIVRMSDDGWDAVAEKFVPAETYVLKLEHSLVALSKWESKFERPFLSKDPKTAEEALGYIQAMAIDPETPPEVFDRLSQDDLNKINDYIEAKMTGTTVNVPDEGKPNRQIISAELIYYWLASYQIPYDVETWHLNRLFALIKVFSAKNAPPKKMGRNEAAAMRSKLNAERRAQMGTTG